MYLIKEYSALIVVSFTLLISNVCISQTKNIKGKIFDKKDNPLPLVHLRFERTNIGTVSNENGEFEIACDLDTSKKRLIISLLGYETKKIVLSNGFNKIVLAENITQLGAVTLFSKDYARELVEKAIQAIPKNYSKAKERHRGFFREITSWSQNPDQPIYIAEGILESSKKPYDQMQRSGDVKLIELRKYESNQLDSLFTRIIGGTHHVHRFDVVQRRRGVLDNPNLYTYKIKDTLQQHGKDVYKIYFEKKDRLSGNLFIMDSTFAIVKAEYNYHSFFGIPGRDRQFLDFTTTYKLGDDHLWRYKSSLYETAFKRQGKQLNLTSTYTTTSIKTDSTSIPYLDRIQYRDIVLKAPKEYHSDFWDNYTIIQPNGDHEKLFESVDHSQKEIEEEVKLKKRPYNKLIEILLRLSSEIEFTYLPIELGSHNMSFSNEGLTVQQSSMTNSLRNTLGLTSTFLYELKNNFHVGYSNEYRVFKSGVTSIDLLLTKTFNLNPNGRPISIEPRVKLGHQQFDWFLNTFNSSPDFSLNGKSFDSDKNAIFLSQRGFRVQPNLKLSIEKSHKLQFFIATGYNFQFNGKTGLLIKEREGFFLFRKKAFVENGDEKLSIESSDDLLKNNINISAGIAFHI